MKNIINEITVILTELNFNYMILMSQKDTVILFYKNTCSENIIFGISMDIYSKHIDMGALCLLEKNIILGCSHRLSISSNLKIIISQSVHQIKDSIALSDQIDYLDDKMKLKQKFLNVYTTIESFAQKNNYTIFKK